MPRCGKARPRLADGSECIHKNGGEEHERCAPLDAAGPAQRAIYLHRDLKRPQRRPIDVDAEARLARKQDFAFDDLQLIRDEFLSQ